MNRAEQHAHYAEVRRRIDGPPPAPILAVASRLRQKPKRFEWTSDKVGRFRLLWDTDVKIADIAAELGCSTSSVMHKRKRLDLPERHPTEPGRKLTANEIVEFRLLWAKGKSVKFIAKRFDLPVRSITGRRKTLGLPARRRGEHGKNNKPLRGHRKIVFYVTKDEKENLYRRATRKGLALSHYMSKLVAAAIEKEDRGRYGHL